GAARHARRRRQRRDGRLGDPRPRDPWRARPPGARRPAPLRDLRLPRPEERVRAARGGGARARARRDRDPVVPAPRLRAARAHPLRGARGHAARDGPARDGRAAPRPGDPSRVTRRLIVNADDFGLTPGVSAGILAARRHGLVTSTTVLVTADPDREQLARARAERRTQDARPLLRRVGARRLLVPRPDARPAARAAAGRLGVHDAPGLVRRRPRVQPLRTSARDRAGLTRDARGARRGARPRPDPLPLRRSLARGPMKAGGLLLGVDVGGTTIAAGAVTAAGEVLLEQRVPTRDRGPGHAVEVIGALIDELCGEASRLGRALDGIG